MRTISIFIILIWLFNPGTLLGQNKDSIAGDLEALQDLYQATNGSGWKNNSGWLQGNPSNNWYGVEVDGTGRVTSINLLNNNLSGNTIPESLGNLKEVRYFNIKGNKIENATLPVEIKNMREVRELYIAGTRSDPTEKFSKHPGKSHTKDAQASNYIIGTLPQEWRVLPNIERIEIASSGITGSLPAEWGELTTIRGFYLGSNEITGHLPPQWADIKKLNHLQLGGNNLTGPLPSEWGKMQYLTELRLGGNDFDGESIPDEWSGMKMLWLISWNGAGFTGDFPQWLGNGDFHQRPTSYDPDPELGEAYHSGLGTIHANFNNWTGTLPNFDNMTWVNVFNVYGSSFKQEIPNNLNVLRRVIQIDLSGVGVSGQMPDLSPLNKLRFINVPNNNLSGNLPNLNTNNGSFRNSQWQNNNFSGSIPESWNFPGSNRIFRLWLNNNNLSGPIPEKLADSGHSYSSEFRVHGNRYLFKDLVPFIQLGPNNFIYGPQQNFGNSRTYSRNPGQTVTIDDFESIVTHSGNRYRWQKNGSNISGASSRTLTLSNLEESHSGIYRLIVTNPGAPELTLTSHDIELKVGDGINSDDSGTVGETGNEVNDDSSDGESEILNIGTPEQISPTYEGAEVLLEPTFKWTSVVDAYNYELHVSTTEEMMVEVITENIEFTPNDQFLENETYYWRVRAINGESVSDWSPIWNFTTEQQEEDSGDTTNSDEEDSSGNETGGTDGSSSTDDVSEILNIDTPEQLSPTYEGAEVLLEPTFKWTSVVDAYNYELHVSSIDQMMVEVITESIEFTSTDQFLENETYYWKVRAINGESVSDWSPVWNFTTEQQEEVSQDAPDNDDTNTNDETEELADSGDTSNSDEEADSGNETGGTDDTSNTDDSDGGTTDEGSDGSEEDTGSDDTNTSDETEELADSGDTSNSDEESDSGNETGGTDDTSNTDDSDGGTTDEGSDGSEEDTGSDDTNTSDETEDGTDTGDTTNSDEEDGSGNEMGGSDDTSNTDDSDGGTTDEGSDGSEEDTGSDDSDDSNTNDESEEETDSGDNSETDKSGGKKVNDNIKKMAPEVAVEMDQNYPNPFNPSTVIQFHLSVAQNISIKVYNMAGREVATLINGTTLGAGTHTASFRADGLSSGIYFYRLVTEREVITRQMTFLK